jgi:hypothetical protein
MLSAESSPMTDSPVAAARAAALWDSAATIYLQWRPSERMRRSLSTFRLAGRRSWSYGKRTWWRRGRTATAPDQAGGDAESDLRMWATMRARSMSLKSDLYVRSKILTRNSTSLIPG